MRHMVNGRVVELPTRIDGSVDTDDLWAAASIPADRMLILQEPDGTNRVINPGEKLTLSSSQYFCDSPLHRRGCIAVNAKLLLAISHQGV